MPNSRYCIGLYAATVSQYMMWSHAYAYVPLAVSPDNMTQSVPSSTALATSLVSALVGRGFSIILSNI